MMSQRKTIDLAVFQGEARRVRVVIKTPVLGELTTRTNSSNCVVTYESGSIIPTVGESYELRWSGGRRQRMTAASAAGQLVTFTGGTGSPLPATGESIAITGFTEPKNIAGWDAQCLVRTKQGTVVGTFEVGAAEDADGGPIVITDASGIIDLVFNETWTAAADPSYLRYDLLITPDDRRPFFPFGGNLSLQERGNSSPAFDSDAEATINLDQDTVIEFAEGLPGENGTGGGGGGSGTVTNFSATPSGIFNVANSTTTPALSLDNQTANTIFAGPSTGSPATPGFRAMVAADIVTHTHSGDDITSGTVADARIASTIARDSEVTAAIAALSSVYQAKDTTLDTYAGIDPSSNVQAILAAANYAAIRTLLGLVIGTDVQAYSSVLATWAATNPSSNAQSLVTAANYAAMRALLDLEAGTDFYSISAADAAIAAATVGLYDIKGGLNCSANPNYPAASKGDVYNVTAAGRVGGASGKVVEVGDTIVCFADNAGGTEASVGTSWLVDQGNVAFTTQGLAIATAASYAAIRALLSLDTGNSPTFLGMTLDGDMTFSAIGGANVNLSAALTLIGAGLILPSITINSVAFAPSSFGATLAALTSAPATLNALHTQGANIASASTVNLSTATGWAVTITGTTTITAFSSQTAGNAYLLTFSGALTLTHNATSLICPGGASITTAAGDTAIALSLGSGNWKILDYTRASGKAVVPPAITETSGLGTGVGTALGNTTNATGGFVTTDGTATLTNKIISLAALPGTDDTYQGIAITGRNAGATIAQWEAVYLNSSGEWVLADANGTSTYPAQGLAVAAYSSGNAATVLVIGTVRNDSWNWTVGGRIYLSATAGALTQTQPSTSGDKVQYIGFAPTADSIFVNPSSTFLEVP